MRTGTTHYSRLHSIPDPATRPTAFFYLLSFILFLFSASLVFAADPAPVYVVEARVAPVTEVLPLNGTITSERSAALSSHVSGLVARVNVDAGDRVAAGEVLVELDPVLAKLALNRAQAALNEGKVALKESNRLRDEAQKLAQSRSIPETTAQARIADVELKAAAVARLEAEYRQQAELVRLHSVVAPFDGVVSGKLTEAGEWVNTGTPVIDLVATDRLRLDVQVPQEYFHLIGNNTPVVVKLDAVFGLEFSSKVTAAVPVNHPNARTFLVRILIEGASDSIVPGMSAQAVFNLQLNETALQLPRDATISYPDGRHSVWVINKVDNKLIASEQQVQLGRGAANNVVIRKGLEPGSIVVVRGNETLQEGQAVQILEQTTAGEGLISDDAPLSQ